MKLSPTHFKGGLAELRVAVRATELGMIPSRPLMDHSRYDLILDDGKSIWRVQIKQCNHKPSSSTGSVELNLRSAWCRTRTKQTRPFYTREEIDAIIVYLPSTQSFYWLPPEVWHGRGSLTLRLKPSKNRQTKNCIFADQFLWPMPS